jgi:D-cysteine desulfhydrase family pyridoxal phosphate-dependent enzyme
MMDEAKRRAVVKRFENMPSVPSANLNTPLEECKRLSDLLSDDVRIFIKRDDFIGPLVWGNKLRKLEYSIGEALSRGGDTIITCGGIQSNHARITAQVCKRIGLDCVLVQNGEIQTIPTGNHKLNLIFNIPIHIVHSRQERESKMMAVYSELVEQGKKPFIIPLGASNGVGSLGFVKAIGELKQQQDDLGIRFDHIFHSSSSGGTQAGLEIGKRLFGMTNLRITGVSPDNSFEEISADVMKCTNEAAALLEIEPLISENDLQIETGYIGEGYGIPSEKSSDVMNLFIDSEGIMLDPIYTAKAAAAMVDYVRKGKISGQSNVLFWHTGGLLNAL